MIPTFIAFLLLAPALVWSATIQAGEEVIISEDQQIEGNLYVAGGNISINSSVDGDVYTAGGNVLVAGAVSDDIVVAGGSVTVLGNSGGDVRVAGGNVLIAGNIVGELIVAGGSVTVAPDVSIGGDVVAASGQLSLSGTVDGDVSLYGGVATINGQVGGNVIANLEDKLTFGNNSLVAGNVIYRAKTADKLSLGENTVVLGEIVFDEVDAPVRIENKNSGAGFVGAFLVVKFAISLVSALVIVWLFRRFSTDLVTGAVQSPLRALGYGLVTLVVTPVAAVLLLVSVLGIPLGLAVFLVYGLLLLITSLYGGVLVGAWISQVIYKTSTPIITWKNVLTGVFLLSVITLIPVVGWVVGFLIFLVTLGSGAELLLKKWRMQQQ